MHGLQRPRQVNGVRALGALMAIDRDTISQQMRSTIPRCISQFVSAPAERPEPWFATISRFGGLRVGAVGGTAHSSAIR
jgi:hypothetical protein